MQRAFSSEFPNDNDELHLGTIWRNEVPCGPAEACFAATVDEAPEEAPLEPDEITEPIEIVETIAIDEPNEIVPAPIGIEAVEDREPEPEARPSIDPVEAIVAFEGPTPMQSEVVLSSRGAELIAEELSIPPARMPTLESFGIAEPIAEPAAEAHDESVTAPSDPFVQLIATLSAVAAASGVSIDAATIEAKLVADPIAIAWRAILRSESEDFSSCTTTLDEWAATTLAKLIDAPSKAAQLRRDLRARGVAAFGLIEAA